MINIYTDGACSSSDKTGGWAIVVDGLEHLIMRPRSMPFEHMLEYIIRQPPRYIYYGYKQDTTNNEMELMAMRMAVWFATTQLPNEHVTIYTDSAYIANCFRDKWYKTWQQNGWRTSRKTPVEHQPLWQTILSMYEQVSDRITIQHVKSHSTNELNNLADQYAVSARLQLREWLAKQE